MKERGAAETAHLDQLIDRITTDANGDDEQLQAFRRAFENEVATPFDATVAGAPVIVDKFDYDGNVRRGLTALCFARDGTEHTVAVPEVAVRVREKAARYLAAYRKWRGVAPIQPGPLTSRQKPGTAVPASEARIELAVLSLGRRNARCRPLGGGETVTLHAAWLNDVAPGEIVSVWAETRWRTQAGKPHLSGILESSRMEAKALGLTPLRLEERGVWNPVEQYWGEPGEPIANWAKPIIARGPRPVFEMEQVLPGADPGDPFSDPIGKSVDLLEAGYPKEAYKVLMDLCEADLRCLDAHAHLGNLEFVGRLSHALRHYEAGFRIGELSLGEGFDGLLPWGWIDNRPFLRCMQGYGLCLWRLRNFEDALRVFERMLWLNPDDNQGVRLLLPEVRGKRPWHDD